MNEPNEEFDSSLPKGFSSYLRTRLQLVSIETQEALVFLKGKLGPVLMVLIAALTAYALTLTALVSFLGKLLGLVSEHPLIGWELIAFLIAGVHLVLIFAMKKKISKKPSTPLYEYSRAEIERDREWIQEHNPKSKNSPTG